MKKIQSVLLGIVLLGTMVACGSKEGSNAKKDTSSSSSTSSSLSGVVYVNIDSLLSNYDYFKDVRKQLEAKGKKAEADLQAKGVAFQRDVAEYQKNAASMSPDQRAKIEERLSRRQQELQMYSQNASVAFGKDEQRENEKLYDKVSSYLKVYAKEKGYKLVLTYSKANPALLYADESLDVTQDVLEGLNEEYKK